MNGIKDIGTIIEKNESFDLNFDFTVRNQKRISNAGAIVIAYWYEYFYRMQALSELVKYNKTYFKMDKDELTKADMLFSEDFIYGNRDESDYQGKGCIITELLNHCIKEGVILRKELHCNSEFPIPYNLIQADKDKLLQHASNFKIEDYNKIENTFDSIDAELKAWNLPLIAVIKIYDNFNDTGLSGNIPDARGVLKEYAPVLITGTKNGKVKILNTLGENWGKDGYGYISDMRLFREIYSLVPIVEHISEDPNSILYSVQIGKSLNKIDMERLNIKISRTKLTYEQRSEISLYKGNFIGDIIKVDEYYKLQIGIYNEIDKVLPLVKVLLQLGYNPNIERIPFSDRFDYIK